MAHANCCRPRIAEEVVQGDTKVFFSQAIEQNMDSIYGLARRLTRNDADAEDLVAEAVAKAWSAIDSLDDRARFRPWLFRILHNRFISDYRKKSVRPEERAYEEYTDDDISAFLMTQSQEFLDWWADPEQEVINNILGENIMAAIDKLPEVFRMTVILVNVEGFTYDEAAEVLGVPPGTVRSRMKRGRTILQKELWEHASDAGLLTTQTTRPDATGSKVLEELKR